MRKIFKVLIIAIFFGIFTPLSQATVLQGGVNADGLIKHFHTIIDKVTGKPVPNARITVPSNNYVTYSDINGHFELKTCLKGQSIISVEKNNYKPYSQTITQKMQESPMIMAIEAISPFDINIETRLCHLGDNNYSEASSNAGYFKTLAAGPIYTKEFYVGGNLPDKQYYLVIGSIVGIDTAMARGIGQNRITNSFASPPSVYLNGHKIAEIQINGDNQKIRLPHTILKFNQKNTIMIRAGRNLMQIAYVDYDDIEFMNISIQAFEKPKQQRLGFHWEY
ncbi:MAG: carboxypeptidase-like regulatory domain-containing protein [Cyanobacteria bacterium RUI128]|nr:carboxypeptidase-like regulatory domain-containing protein [Cyanobacteria bacterium RUI128]